MKISDTPRAGFKPAQNLSSDFAEWSCAVVATKKPQKTRVCKIPLIDSLVTIYLSLLCYSNTIDNDNISIILN